MLLLRFVAVIVVLLFWGLSAIICVICERIGRSHVREERGMNKERARKEQGMNEHVPLTALLHKHELHDSTMRQLSFICEIMQLAAFLCVISVICGRNGRSHVRSEQGKNEGILSQLYCINMNCMTLL